MLAPVLDSALPLDPLGNPIITLSPEDMGDEEAMRPYDEDATNLVDAFNESAEGRLELEKIADLVEERFDTDWEGNAGYRKTWAKNCKLLAGDLPKKTFPFAGAANAHVPVMLENMMRLSCRIESELFGDWANVFSVPPVGEGGEDISEILTLHGNWQIREQIPDFERQMQRGLLMFLMGDVTCWSYWDPLTELNCHNMLTADEFVTPFAFVSTKPDYGDLPHYTMVLRYYRHQLQAQKGRWVGVDEVLEGEGDGFGDEPDHPIRDGVARVQGEELPDDLCKGAPYVILHHEGWMELPLQTKDRWVQVIMEKKSRRILSLSIHEEADWQDRIRLESQQAEMDQYVAQKGMYSQMQAQRDQAMAPVQQGAQQVAQLHSQGAIGPQQGMAMVQSLHEAVPPELPPPPPPPAWLSDPEDLAAKPKDVKKRPILMFAHGVCMEPMTGSLGLGVGRVLADYNRAANTALSQFTDQATLGNAKGFIVADTVDFDRPFTWAPGKINKVKGVSGMELKNAIMPVDPGPANPQLVQIMQLMQANGQAAAQAPDVLSGDPGKSGETYRGIATRIEQATKQLTVVGRRFAQFVRTILRNNARLNAVFLRDEEIFEVTKDALGTMMPMKVGREMYQRDYKVEIRSDLKFSGNAERTAEADQILQMTTAFPPLMQDQPFFYQAVKGSLEARGKRKLVAYLGPEPPVPQFPFGAAPMPVPPGGGAPPPLPGGPPQQNAKGTGDPGQESQGPPQQHPQGTGGPVNAPPPQAS